MVMAALKITQVDIFTQISDFVKVSVAQNSHKFNDETKIKSHGFWVKVSLGRN